MTGIHCRRFASTTSFVTLLALAVATPVRAAIVYEIHNDRVSFDLRLGAAVRVVDFDDITTKGETAVPFSSLRYRVDPGLLIQGQGSQFVSRTFMESTSFVPSSPPNSYAPGPKGKVLGEGGNQTDLFFFAGVQPARVAGVGMVFIDADSPGAGPSSLTVFDELGAQLQTTPTVSGGKASQLFRGIVAIDDSTDSPVATIFRAHVVSGQGWPEVFDNEGVTLDDIAFAIPVANTEPRVRGRAATASRATPTGTSIGSTPSACHRRQAAATAPAIRRAAARRS